VADTTYIVLLLESTGWTQVSTKQASSSEDAIRRTASDPGTYVAVPARSWKPVMVRTEQKTVIHLDTPPAE
jgi:hypothetical protein